MNQVIHSSVANSMVSLAFHATWRRCNRRLLIGPHLINQISAPTHDADNRLNCCPFTLQVINQRS